MNIKQTTFNKKGPIQIQDHGQAYIVSYPSEQAGYQREKVFNKAIGPMHGKQRDRLPKK